MPSNNIGFRVKLSFPRPSTEVIRAFCGWSTGNVCDANGRMGALDYRIKPLAGAWKFVGPALTVRARPVDNLILYQALDICQPGDVLVITNDESTTTSVFGDHVCAIAKARGVAAMVTDGLVRDAAGIREVGLPVFARGLNPNGPFKDGPGEVNFPIAIGGLPVNPGDLLVGDEDGVVVVRREDIAVVMNNLETVGKKEWQMTQDIAAGKHISDLVRQSLKAKGVELIE